MPKMERWIILPCCSVELKSARCGFASGGEALTRNRRIGVASADDLSESLLGHRTASEAEHAELQVKELRPEPVIVSNFCLEQEGSSICKEETRSRKQASSTMATLQTGPPQADENSALMKIIHWYKLFDSDTPPRLGIEIKDRLPYTAASAFAVGMAIGASHGSKKAAYQFRAENAHRFPTTSTGWFLYHKSKNYKSIVGGVKDGMKLGLKLGAGAMAFCLFEETVDYARHDRRDFLSTVTAGLSFSGIYSLLGTFSVG